MEPSGIHWMTPDESPRGPSCFAAIVLITRRSLTCRAVPVATSASQTNDPLAACTTKAMRRPSGDQRASLSRTSAGTVIGHDRFVASEKIV